MARTHLISGTTSGIGRELASQLREAGDEVIPILRPPAARAADSPPAVYCDFGQPGSVDEAFAEFDRPLDGVIHCAGILLGKDAFHTSADDWAAVMNVNVISPALVVAKVAPLMRAGGVIVLLGSISGFRGSFDDAYAASKGAVHSLVKSLAVKLAPDCRVVGIAPGITTGTRMAESLAPGRFEQTLAEIPLGRPCQAAEVATLIRFVMSESCASMTGCVIDLNGGQYLR